MGPTRGRAASRTPRRSRVPATATVLYSATDVQGNVESPGSQAVRIDTVAPASSITCNGGACAATAYSSAVQVALSATDAGSGVSSIRSTTDGSDPTAASPAYSTPFSVSSTTVVKYRAFDAAGNAEAVHSQTITITAAPISTVVTLGFDDSVADQAQVPAMLDARGMKGTFFVNSGEVGGPGYMTWAQVDGIAADGHEIAGHTLHHPHLTTLSAANQQTEICQDRQNLLARGYAVTNFAYPYGEGYDNATTRSIVQGCGYSSARMAWGLWYAGCDGCVYADTIPPADKWATKAGDSIQDTHSLADIEAQVTRAEQHGGGWLQLVFHHVCANDCDQYSVTPTNLSAFLDWLQARSAQGTVVRTTQQVIGGTVTPPPPPTDTTAPTSTITCNNAACAAAYRSSVQVRLAATDNTGGSGVNQIKYTTNGADPRTSGTVYTTAFNVTSTRTVRFSAIDTAGNAEAPQSVNIVIDTTAPTTAIRCNNATCTTGWYRTGTLVSLAATDAGSGIASIKYTTNGADPRTTGTTYTGPFTLNATATVRYSATDAAGNVESPKSQSVRIDTAAPTVTLTAPTNGLRVLTGTVHLAEGDRVRHRRLRDGLGALLRRRHPRRHRHQLALLLLVEGHSWVSHGLGGGGRRRRQHPHLRLGRAHRRLTRRVSSGSSTGPAPMTRSRRRRPRRRPSPGLPCRLRPGRPRPRARTSTASVTTGSRRPIRFRSRPSGATASSRRRRDRLTVPPVRTPPSRRFHRRRRPRR